MKMIWVKEKVNIPNSNLSITKVLIERIPLGSASGVAKCKEKY